jgi:hypothetical protein
MGETSCIHTYNPPPHGGNREAPDQPGWWCSLNDPDDLDGRLVDDDNLVAEMARRTAQAIDRGDPFSPVLIRAIRRKGIEVVL